MIISIVLMILSPYTAFIPMIYMAYKVLSKKVIIHRNPWNIGLLLLFVWSIISGILNHNLISSALSIAFFMYFCLSVYLENYFTSEDKIEKLCRYLIYFSILAAVLGLIEKITFTYFNFNLWNKLLGLAPGAILNHRIYSTFGNPNVAGDWFSIMIILCIYFISRTTNKNKLFYQASMFLFFFGLFLTGSRGANIGLLTGLIAYFCLEKNKKSIGYLALFFVLIIALAFIPSQFVYLNNLMGHELNSSASSRYEIWRGCLQMIKLKPLAGWGLMGIYTDGLNFINFHMKVYHGQNLWLSIATTLGLVGFSIYIFMKFYLYSGLKMLYKNNCRLVPLLAGIQALVIGHGLVDFTIMTPQSGLLFVSCSAIISSLIIKYSTVLASSPVPVVQYNTLSKTG